MFLRFAREHSACILHWLLLLLLLMMMLLLLLLMLLRLLMNKLRGGRYTTRAMTAVRCWGGKLYCGGGGSSRAQPLQSGCSARVTRCLCAPVPANGFRLVFTNAETAEEKLTD